VTVQLDHTIVWVRKRRESADFLTSILGLPDATTFGPFLVVQLENGVSLDYCELGDGEISPQHYAFLITEDEFDAILARIETRGLAFWADPGRTRPGEINRDDGGRGLYFLEPGGHLLEIITRPYGSGDIRG